jgi:acyl carrier protein
MAMITQNDIVQILRDQLFLDVSSIDATTPLFSSGLVDSFSLATLIVELETRGDFRMAPLDVTLENLDTIERMLRFVSSRGGQPAH